MVLTTAGFRFVLSYANFPNIKSDVHQIDHFFSSSSSFSSGGLRARLRRRVGFNLKLLSRRTPQPPSSASRDSETATKEDEDSDEEVSQQQRQTQRGESFYSPVIAACLVGVLTGVSIVIFNKAVHEIHDFFWGGIPYQGASWLREETSSVTWKQVISVPLCGGLIVSILNVIPSALEARVRQFPTAALQPFFKAAAACITLATGNSLGPEGPSVDIGASIATGVGHFFGKTSEMKLSLVASGSAAGISAGFNAAVAGCFFAIESVLWPSQAEFSVSLTNTTSMVTLSAVIASVLSEIGLGAQPAFKVPEYIFHSPSELLLYLLLGFLCGLVSLILSRSTSYMVVIVDHAQRATGLPKTVFPVFGGLIVGVIAVSYPEVLYWGFENVDILLESLPFSKGLSISLLLQLVAVKIVATSICRASGLVGGYYAPSLFIGAATGMAYGKIINLVTSQSNSSLHLFFIEVASPQAYGLVGMAATLAGVCQVPLTAVLLLFELTRDYRIILPLLGAVGLSSWITSGETRKTKDSFSKKVKLRDTLINPQYGASSGLVGVLSTYSVIANASTATKLSEMETSLNVSGIQSVELEKKILVTQAMRTKFVTISMTTLVTEAVSLMLAEKQSCAMITDMENTLLGLLTLDDIQEFAKSAKNRCQRNEGPIISDLCSLNHKNFQVSVTAIPDMNLLYARHIMAINGITKLPVVSELVGDHKGRLVGLLDEECISLACRAVATKECLSSVSIDQYEGNE